MNSPNYSIMLLLKKMILFVIITILTISCKNSDTKKANQDADATLKPTYELAGNYVTTSYEKRTEGYDWVSVAVKQLTDSSLTISVRSRADKKKSTCTFDGKATKLNDTVYVSTFEGKNILYTFSNNALSIHAQQDDDQEMLSYFCSGGGSLADTYIKINETLDASQIDSRVFQKIVFLQNIGFDISTTGNGSIQQLTIAPFGLELDNSPIHLEIDGTVVDAEIEDLNNDGFPEVLIYTASAGSGSYGDVLGYSVNNGKSISSIYFPPISENPNANKGYMGHDVFAIVENTLVQRFRIYNEGDSNANPTGNWRQIQYNLKDGEASRKFEIDTIAEYPAN